MLSKMVLAKKSLCRRVEASLLEHARDAALGLDGYFGSAAGNEATLPDFGAFLTLLQAKLQEVRGKLEEADRAHLDEVANDRRLRRQRDAAAAKLAERMVAVRDTFDGVYGRGRAEEIFGFGTGIRPDPRQVRELAERALTKLSDPELALPEPRLLGIALSREELAAQLQEPLAALVDALDQLHREKTRFDGSLTIKRKALAEFKTAYVWLSRIVEAIYIVAGRPELASRLRPSQHYPVIGDVPDESGNGTGDETTDLPPPEDPDEGSDEPADPQEVAGS